MIRHKNAGFTIVETMMFLAVSAAIFVSVALMISGQLDKYQSRDAVNQLESNVRGVLNDVTNGYYPLTAVESFTCSSLTSTAANRGENQGCVFAGKSISFTTDGMVIDTWVTPIASTYINKTAPLLTPNKITKVGSLEETKAYQWGIKPTASQSDIDAGKNTFYILNTVYSTAYDVNNSFVSGAQNVALWKESLGYLSTLSPGNNVVCFSNGSHNSSLVFGIAGALTVTANFQDTCHE